MMRHGYRLDQTSGLKLFEDIANIIGADANMSLFKAKQTFDSRGLKGSTQHTQNRCAMPVAQPAVKRPVNVRLLIRRQSFTLAIALPGYSACLGQAIDTAVLGRRIQADQQPKIR